MLGYLLSVGGVNRHETDSEVRHPTLPERSSFVGVEVGEDNLPVAMTIKPSWKDAFGPTEYGESIMTAYLYAVLEQNTRRITSGRTPDPGIGLRDMVPTLLRTRDYAEYRELYLGMCGAGSYLAYGLGLDEFDQPAMIVRADNAGLTSIVIDARWAAAADAFTIAHDIVACSDQIRMQRPRLYVDSALEGESDDQLRARLIEHVNRLVKDYTA
ncbi:hypothetical protein [Nocardia bovistercoris]|uniref:Uncharacterized protein n=1 Tax=Nocardia bovistercoris TaxID=2785916 RepID=A0A931IGV7_9NOCA|nr:hypothetical protein [Nocardia bovistercoris]MBH0779433.1 hypothetical protein [Nocardia bovistercoris]